MTNKSDNPSMSGSGYEDLEGTLINYAYGGFSGFQFAVLDNKIRWRGVDRYFLGIVREVTPQISKVADNVYFSSWSTGGNGGDDVVHNFNTMEVNAHLNPDESSPETLEMIHGVIHCWNTPDCVFPEGELTSDDDLFPLIDKNMEEQNLPLLFDPDKNNKPRSSADHAARAELAELGPAIRSTSAAEPARFRRRSSGR